MTEPAGDAKRYNRIRLITTGIRLILTVVFLVCCIITPFSRILAATAETLTAHPYGTALVFLLGLGLLQTALLLPVDFYSGFMLEHRYGMSNQTLLRWAGEEIKGMLVGTVLLLPPVLLLMYLLRNHEQTWWLFFAGGLFGFSLLLGVIAPQVILPLFYKQQPIKAGRLRDALEAMARNAGMLITGVFVIDLSKNTKKANAAFTGLGRSKRVLLGDTLLSHFTEEEILAVFAHELGHYRLRHLPKRILVSGISTFLAMGLAAWVYGALVNTLGFHGIADPAALPLLALVLAGYGLATAPLNNAWSRAHERQADRFALDTLGMPDAFISGMRKLQSLNLADPEPHPWVERLFHSHPSISKRIRAAEDYRSSAHQNSTVL